MVRMLDEAVLQAKVGRKMQKSCHLHKAKPSEATCHPEQLFLILSEIQQKRENPSFI